MDKLGRIYNLLQLSLKNIAYLKQDINNQEVRDVLIKNINAAMSSINEYADAVLIVRAAKKELGRKNIANIKPAPMPVIDITTKNTQAEDVAPMPVIDIATKNTQADGVVVPPVLPTVAKDGLIPGLFKRIAKKIFKKVDGETSNIEETAKPSPETSNIEETAKPSPETSNTEEAAKPSPEISNIKEAVKPSPGCDFSDNIVKSVLNRQNTFYKKAIVYDTPFKPGVPQAPPLPERSDPNFTKGNVDYCLIVNNDVEFDIARLHLALLNRFEGRKTVNLHIAIKEDGFRQESIKYLKKVSDHFYIIPKKQFKFGPCLVPHGYPFGIETAYSFDWCVKNCGNREWIYMPHPDLLYKNKFFEAINDEVDGTTGVAGLQCHGFSIVRRAAYECCNCGFSRVSLLGARPGGASHTVDIGSMQDGDFKASWVVGHCGFDVGDFLPLEMYYMGWTWSKIKKWHSFANHMTQGSAYTIENLCDSAMTDEVLNEKKRGWGNRMMQVHRGLIENYNYILE